MKELIKKIQREVNSLLVGLSAKKISKPAFLKVYKDAKKIYLDRFTNFSYDKYVIPEWLDNIKAMGDAFLNNFHFNFLRLPVIRKTMFVTSPDSWKKTQLAYLESKLPKDILKEILVEYNLGKPIMTDWQYITSTNTIHLLYHFIRFSSEQKIDFNNISTVVEFGGGYGDAAKIYKKINPRSTYIITDLPIFSFLQLVYLKSIFGEKEVFLVEDINKIQKGKINIIPFNKEKLMELAKNIKQVDLFISTWALSETPAIMQDFIKSLNYFDAKYILMGYQKSNKFFVDSENVKNIPQNYKITFNKETEYTKDSYYLFCEKRQ